MSTGRRERLSCVRGRGALRPCLCAPLATESRSAAAGCLDRSTQSTSMARCRETCVHQHRTLDGIVRHASISRMHACNGSDDCYSLATWLLTTVLRMCVHPLTRGLVPSPHPCPFSTYACSFSSARSLQVGFDPLGLGEDPEALKWYVQAELVHARFGTYSNYRRTPACVYGRANACPYPSCLCSRP